ncbi:hypothetical protein [Bauldia sp.]|uniref:hypothetical protein n=1 Tax=Bauldia sp. TaxID=2575872 RepID=UPI003BACA4E3
MYVPVVTDSGPEPRHNALKIWKLPPIDYTAMHRWDAYTEARDEMLVISDRSLNPQRIVRGKDRWCARPGTAVQRPMTPSPTP